MNNKAHLRPQDYDGNGDIIPMACKEEKGDLISRSALKKALREAHINMEITFGIASYGCVMNIIDNAPTVSDRYDEGYAQGYIDGSTGADWKGDAV